MKHRLIRVREILKRELSELISRTIVFPATLVTVHDVDITPDLRQAHVFVSAIGDPKQLDSVIPILEKHRVELQHQLSRRVVLKFTPQLHFKLDDSIERGTRVIDIMERLDIPDDGPASVAPEQHHD